jgi:cell filamentation protein
VTFDPFGDFETRGYLRNFVGEKDSEIVRRLEHTSFTTGIDTALDRLATMKRICYQDVLDTHKILFEAVYPWAGQDRLRQRCAVCRAGPDLGSGGEIGQQLDDELGAGKLDGVDFQSAPADEAQDAGYRFRRLDAARAALERT